jgi:hypothetical protein
MFRVFAGLEVHSFAPLQTSRVVLQQTTQHVSFDARSSRFAPLQTSRVVLQQTTQHVSFDARSSQLQQLGLAR